MTINRDIMLYSMVPHTHVRGIGWHYELVYPGWPQAKSILSVPNYDFDWQHEYVFASSLKIPAGTKLHANAWYDNSAANKSNPDPTKDVCVGRSDVGRDDVHEPDVQHRAAAAGVGRSALIDRQTNRPPAAIDMAASGNPAG